MSYKANRLAADLLLTQQKAIIEKYQNRLDFNRAKVQHAFTVDETADSNENTDLFFFEYRRLRIACRMRFDLSSHTYNDITIRSKLASGNRTEIDKINDGHGDYMLYCWGDRESVKEFVIVDLDEFRERQESLIRYRDKWNTDKQSAFNGYDIRKIIKTPCCVVAELDHKAIGA